MSENQKVLRKILYASFQTGEALPGYVKYALEGLSRTGFSVVFLTNERDLDPSAHAFLDAHKIELFFTENRGFDFGMWKRYLQYTAKFRREGWDRLVLMNDSVVYFQNRFLSLLSAAEENPADVVSLTENDEYAPHLQSFFLYLKSSAIAPFCERLLREPEGADFLDTVKRLEVGSSVFLRDRGLTLSAMFHTQKPVIFSYPELISQKCGFVKRKLLQKRWTRGDAYTFWENDAGEALSLDYAQFIAQKGQPDRDFELDWLREGEKPFWEKMCEKFRFAYYRVRWLISKSVRR